MVVGLITVVYLWGFRLLTLANKNTEYPVKSEFQKSNNCIFSVNMSPNCTLKIVQLKFNFNWMNCILSDNSVWVSPQYPALWKSVYRVIMQLSPVEAAGIPKSQITFFILSWLGIAMKCSCVNLVAGWSYFQVGLRQRDCLRHRIFSAKTSVILMPTHV